MISDPAFQFICMPVQRGREQPADGRSLIEAAVAGVKQAMEATVQGKAWRSLWFPSLSVSVCPNVACIVAGLLGRVPELLNVTQLDMDLQGRQQIQMQQMTPRRRSIAAQTQAPTDSFATEPFQQRQGPQRGPQQRRGRQQHRPQLKRLSCLSGWRRTPML